MTPDIELLKTVFLPDFPSGSSINYRDNALYLVGDDANTILILDTNYAKISSVQLFNYPGKRIPKSMKADLEASVFITLQDNDYLLVVGSASTAQREKVIAIPFSQNKLNKAQALTVPTKSFIDRLRFMGIPEINIEGATMMGEILVLSNRGNRKNTTNHIILTTRDFWRSQDEAAVKIIPVKISSTADAILGISEVCYEKQTDTLLFSFSSEHTDNAYNDGIIGDSYIGWIDNITKRINATSLEVDRMINLTSIHEDFKAEKIEGLCVEAIHNHKAIITLIADNDKGQSKLFKVRLTI